MFKNVTPLILPASVAVPGFDALADALAARPFAPTAPTQTVSCGFVRPKPKAEESDSFAVDVGHGRVVFACQIERRQVPPAAVDKRVNELAAQIEEATGRKPGKKARKDLKEQATHELLPQAFPKSTRVYILADWAARRLYIDTTAGWASDLVLTLLADAGLATQLVLTIDNPGAVMHTWLENDEQLPEGFWLGKVLTVADDEGSVSWTDCDLTGEDVQAHLSAGKRPVRLSLGVDERCSFDLTATLQLRGFKTLELQADPEAEAWLGEAALVSAELVGVYALLERAMGGMSDMPEAAPAAATSATPDDAQNDPIYEEAVTLVHAHQKASISLVQRHLRIGYNRASRLLERMEVEGLVSPMKHDGSRDLKAAA